MKDVVVLSIVPREEHIDIYNHTCGALLIALEETEEGPVVFDASFDYGLAHVQLDEPCPLCNEPLTHETIRPGYRPQHKRGYYRVVNEWLTAQGYEAEEAEVIDRMDLPKKIRR